jgi:hypothetical protein
LAFIARQLVTCSDLPYYMAPFEFKTIEQQLELRGVLKALEEELPVKAPKLSEANMARRFYYASHGIFDYIIKILDEAVSRGGSGPEGALALVDFAAAFKSSIWRDAPKGSIRSMWAPHCGISTSLASHSISGTT